MKARRQRKNGDQWRRTFCELAAECRRAAARRAWERARLASVLRRDAQDKGSRKAARVLGRIKHAAIARASELAPEQVRVTLDTDFHVGLLSVRFDGHGRLHLPAAAEMPAKRIA